MRLMYRITGDIEFRLDKKMEEMFQGMEENENIKKSGFLAISANSNFLKAWDLLLLITAMYILLDDVLALNKYYNLRFPSKIQLIFRISFYLDIFLSFFRASQGHTPNYQYLRNVMPNYLK